MMWTDVEDPALAGFGPADPATASTVDALTTTGRVFLGAIRQLMFWDERLLVVAGRGVRVVDLVSGELQGHDWPETHVQGIARAGQRLLVWTADAAYLAEPGVTLGAPFVERELRSKGCAATETQIAIPSLAGVSLFDAGGAPSKELTISAGLREKLGGEPRIDKVILSPDGRLVAALSGKKGLTLWDVDTGAVVLDGVSFSPRDAFFLPDGRLAYLEAFGFKVIDPASPDVTSDLPWHKRSEPCFDGDRAILPDTFGGHAQWSLESMTEVSSHPGRAKHLGSVPSHSVAAVSAHDVAVYAASYGTLHISGRHEHVLGGWPSKLEGLAVSVDGLRLVSKTHRSEALAVDRASNTARTCRDEHWGAESVTLTADGQYIVLVFGDSREPLGCTAVPFGAGEPSSQPALLTRNRWLVPHGGDGYLAPTYDRRAPGYVAVCRAGQANASLELRRGDEAPSLVASSPAGGRIAVAWDNAVVVYEDATGDVLETHDIDGSRGLTLGADGLACISSDADRVETLHLRSGEVVVDQALSKGPGGRTMLVFGDESSDEGSLLFVGRTSGVLEVRDARDGSLLREIAAHAGPFRGLVYRAGLVWSLGDDSVIRAFGVPTTPAS